MNIFIKCLFILFITFTSAGANAQIIATGNTSETKTSYPAYPDNHKIYLFNDLSSGGLNASPPVGGTNVIYTWYKYDNGAWLQISSGNSAELSAVLQETGYRVNITDNGNPLGDYYCWVFQPEIISAEIEEVDHNCVTLSLNVIKDVKPLIYYDLTNGSPVELDYSYSYSWQSVPVGNIAGKTEATPSIAAPFENTEYAVTINAFNGATSLNATSEIVAKAVKADFTMTAVDRENINEVQEVESFKGSAPFKINFKGDISKGNITEYRYAFTRETDKYEYPVHLMANTNFDFKEFSKYSVTLTVTNNYSGCSDTKSNNQISAFEMSVDAPNVFTPDGDGTNDKFMVIYSSVKDFKMTILNRWGRIVFSTTNPGDAWDGTIGGKKASEGVYFYFIEAKGYNEGEVIKRKKPLHLIRGN